MGREEDEKEHQKRLSENLMRDLGPLVPYFKTPSVTNVYVYGSGEVEIDEFGRGAYYPGFSLSIADRTRIINSLASVADIPIDLWERPTLEAIIPDYKIRTTAILAPWIESPEITFRRPAGKVYTMEEYVSSGRLGKEFYEKILFHLNIRSNIVVSGSTGSGKTTFTNALLHKMSELTPDERFYIVEDVPELQCSAKRTTQLYIRKEQAIAAIQTALRWTPKRIIFGEIRSADVAVELLEAWNTGHPGNVTTIHADNAVSTVFRIEGLLRQRIHGKLPDLRWSIGLIIHLGSKAGFGPFINEVLTMEEIADLRGREAME
jgi:type IV secretion system protein VirB11